MQGLVPLSLPRLSLKKQASGVRVDLITAFSFIHNRLGQIFELPIPIEVRELAYLVSMPTKRKDTSTVG